MRSAEIEGIRRDLKPLSRYEVVIYGSFVTGEFREGSDIDVAVITRIRDKEENMKILKGLIGKVKPIYDVRIFELLPIRIKASVIREHVVVFGDELEISEYFYFWRKFWEDVRHRISYHESYREKMKALERERLLRKKLRRNP